MQKKEKKPQAVQVMNFFQYLIAILFSIFGILATTFGVLQQNWYKVIYGIIDVLIAVVAVFAIIYIKKKDRKGYVLSIVSFSFLTLSVLLYQFSDNILYFQFKDLQTIGNNFWKDPFLILFYFAFFITTLLIYIFSPRVKVFFNIEAEVNGNKKEFKFIIIYLIYLGLGLANAFFQTTFFQPTAFRNNRELVTKVEPFFGKWNTTETFEGYDPNNGRFFININEDGSVRFSIPDEERTFSIFWEGYIVDMSDSQILVGEKLYNGNHIGEFLITIDEFDEAMETIVFSARNNSRTVDSYEYIRE